MSQSTTQHGSRVPKMLFGGLLVTGTAAAAYVVIRRGLKSRGRREGLQTLTQIDPSAENLPPNEPQEPQECCGGSGSRTCACESKEEGMNEQSDSVSAQVEQSHSSSGGCSRNQGVMAEWQGKLHIASEAVSETLLALRGGSMSTRQVLHEIQEHLSLAECTAQDAIYCTDNVDKLNQLIKDISPLLAPDASSVLLHPRTGEETRQRILDAVSSWDD